jgi:hypothetical protein
VSNLWREPVAFEFSCPSCDCRQVMYLRAKSTGESCLDWPMFWPASAQCHLCKLRFQVRITVEVAPQ